MSATIIFSPQFKDELLEKLPYGKDGSITVRQMQEQFFPDHCITDIGMALRALRRWRVIDCQWTPNKKGRILHWWRVA